MTSVKHIIGGLLCAVLIGCSTTPDPQLVQTEGYETGYSDGCATGQMRQNAFSRDLIRDIERYDREDAYRLGWNDGFRDCGGRTETSDPYADSLDRWYSGGPHK